MISSAALSSAETIDHDYYKNHHDDDDDDDDHNDKDDFEDDSVDDDDDDDDDVHHHYNNSSSNSSNNPSSSPPSSQSSFLGRVFRSCSDDPKGSVHRTWSVCLLSILLYIALAFLELFSMFRSSGVSSRALFLGCFWTCISHLNLAIFGTFVLKRFPTAFAYGILMSVLFVMVHQNLILAIIFLHHPYDRYSYQHHDTMFGNICLFLATVLFFFMTLLYHFRNEVVVPMAHIKGFRSSKTRTITTTSHDENNNGARVGGMNPMTVVLNNNKNDNNDDNDGYRRGEI